MDPIVHIKKNEFWREKNAGIIGSMFTDFSGTKQVWKDKPSETF